MRAWVSAACIASIACGDSSPPPSGDGTGTSSSSDGPIEPDSGAATSSTTDGADSTSEAGTTVAAESTGADTSAFPVPVCGDGLVEGDEECDDRNADPDDGCDALCNHAAVVEWTVVVDGPDSGDDIARAVALAPNGDIWVAGTLTDVVGVARLHRYDPDGRLLAEIEVASNGTDDVRGLAVDDAGALYVAGSSLDLGVDEAWLVKLDELGTETWRYTRLAGPDTASVVARGVALGASEIHVIGWEEHTSDPVDLDTWLVTLDADGAPQWEHTYAGDPEQDAFAAGVAVSGDGTIVAAGAETRPNQDFDGWVRKLDPAGVEVWTVTEIGAGLATEETIRDVTIAADGVVVVTGLVDDFDGPMLFTRAYDSGGKTLWTRTYAGPRGITTGARALALGPRGEVAITGSVGIAGQSSDVIVRQYSADGDFELWTSYYGNARAGLDDVGHAIVFAADGSVIAAGETFVSGRGRDWWLRKLAAP